VQFLIIYPAAWVEYMHQNFVASYLVESVLQFLIEVQHLLQLFLAAEHLLLHLDPDPFAAIVVADHSGYRDLARAAVVEAALG